MVEEILDGVNAVLLPGFGAFLEPRRLFDQELTTLVRWVEAGALEGNPATLPEPLVFPTGWRLGPPDHVLEMPEPYTVAARASDVYRCFVIPTSFPVDRWVTKAEWAPGDRKLVHHILSYIDTTTVAEALDRADPGPGYTCFGAGPDSSRREASPAGRRVSRHGSWPTVSACCSRKAPGAAQLRRPESHVHDPARRASLGGAGIVHGAVRS
jgi:hypothetical protein